MYLLILSNLQLGSHPPTINVFISAIYKRAYSNGTLKKNDRSQVTECHRRRGQQPSQALCLLFVSRKFPLREKAPSLDISKPKPSIVSSSPYEPYHALWGSLNLPSVSNSRNIITTEMKLVAKTKSETRTKCLQLGELNGTIE